MKKATIHRMILLLMAFQMQAALSVAVEQNISAIESEFRQLEQDIPSLYLVNGLYLSQEQARKLTDLLDRASKIEEKHFQKSQKIVQVRQKDFDRDLDDLVKMVSRQGKVDKQKLSRSSSSRRTRQSRKELIALRMAYQRKLDELADKAYEVLTKNQRSIVNDFVPCFIPPRDFREPERVGQAAGDTSFVESVLIRLRRLPDEQLLSVAIERALDRLVPYAMKKQYIPYSEEAEQNVRDELSVRLESAVTKIRNISNVDFELEKQDIAAEMLPMQTAGKSNDSSFVRWKIRRYILNTGILDVMRARAHSSGEKIQLPKVVKEDKCKVTDMSKAMRTVSVLTGLDLTHEQACQLSTIVRNAVGANENIHDEGIEVMKQGMEKYGKLRKELAVGQPTKKAEADANHYHYKIKQLREDKLVKELLEYESEMDQLLTVNQVEYLSGDIRAMLKKSAVSRTKIDRIMNRAKRVMTKARHMSSIEFSQKNNELCVEFINECVSEQGLEPDSIDMEAETKRAIKVLEHARKLSHTEYSSKRDELASDLCPKRSGPRPLTYGAKYHRGEPVPILSSSSRLLFSEVSCNILEKMCGLAR